MRGMDIDHVEAGGDRAPRGGAIAFDEGPKIALGQRRRAWHFTIEGFVADRNDRPRMLAAQLDVLVAEPRSAMPAPAGRALPAGVGELHTGGAAEAVQEIGDALELRDLRIAPQAVTARRDPPLLGDGGRFDENKSGAAERKASEMNQVKIVGEAVMRAIHRHRRHHDAIAGCLSALSH